MLSTEISLVFTNSHKLRICVNKIGQHYVIDADLKEETVTKVRLVLGFDSKGNIKMNEKEKIYFKNLLNSL